jgi:hypothetical protein
VGGVTGQSQTALQVRIFSEAGTISPTSPGCQHDGLSLSMPTNTELTRIFGAFGAVECVPLPKIDLNKLTKLSGNVMLNRSSDVRAPEDARATQRRNIMFP